MADPNPHQLMTCPYNMAHQVEHYRMHIHIQKCRKQYPNSGKMTCPFDSTHVVDDAEMDSHVLRCGKRGMLDTQLYVVDNDYRPVVTVQAPPTPVQCEENWEETETTSYIPDPSRRGPHIITRVRGATPSERRQARMEAIRNYRPRE